MTRARSARDRWAAAVGAVALVLGLAACAPASDAELPAADARAVTSEEAQTLAAMRLRNLDAGTRSIVFELDDAGRATAFAGWFDYETGVGYGRAAGDVDELLLWNHEVVGSRPSTADAAPLPIPGTDALATEWQGGGLDASGSRVHAVLAAIAALGSDRPENPLLLQQSGALWLGERTVDGIRLSIFAGPPSDEALDAGESADPADATVRYWVDDVGLLHRVDVRLGGEENWSTVAFGTADDVALGDPFSQATDGAAE